MTVYSFWQKDVMTKLLSHSV